MKKRKIFSIFCLFFIITVKQLFPQAGQLDTTFGQNGIKINNIGASNNFINSIVLQKDGNIIAASYSANEDSSEVVNIVARYLGNDQTTGITENRIKKLPTSFNLFQNYPNPFNPSTVISWEQPFSGHVSLKVAILVDKEEHSGNYKIEFNASSFSSGVYFYQLRAGSFIETKKMLLLR